MEAFLSLRMFPPHALIPSKALVRFMMQRLPDIRLVLSGILTCFVNAELNVNYTRISYGLSQWKTKLLVYFQSITTSFPSNDIVRNDIKKTFSQRNCLVDAIHISRQKLQANGKCRCSNRIAFIFKSLHCLPVATSYNDNILATGIEG